MNTFTGIAIDYEHGYKYPYPKDATEASKVRLPYDFIFTKKGTWYYMSSSSKPSDFKLKVNLCTPVESKGENWKVVDAITGEIKMESK